MSARDDRSGHHSGEEQLFDDIREFLSLQSVDRIYEDLSQAYWYAANFIERELREIDDFGRMLRGLERLVEDVFEGGLNDELRAKLAEAMYTFGLAHYSLMQQVGSIAEGESSEQEGPEPARPLVIYDIWFPSDIAIERAQDGLYLHISDGRVDASIYLGASANQRGALVDLADHWEYAASNTGPFDRDVDFNGSLPMLTIEIDYNGSELVDAHDHVDVLFFDDESEPAVRMHARAADLRAIVDELQAGEREESI